MGDNSFTSILLLLILFIVLPSVLKFVGQYTMKNKTAGQQEPQGGPAEHEEPLHDHIPQHPFTDDMKISPSHPHGSYKPIKPKWF